MPSFNLHSTCNSDSFLRNLWSNYYKHWHSAPCGHTALPPKVVDIAMAYARISNSMFTRTTFETTTISHYAFKVVFPEFQCFRENKCAKFIDISYGQCYNRKGAVAIRYYIYPVSGLTCNEMFLHEILTMTSQLKKSPGCLKTYTARHLRKYFVHRIETPPSTVLW